MTAGPIGAFGMNKPARLIQFQGGFQADKLKSERAPFIRKYGVTLESHNLIEAKIHALNDESP